MSEGSSENNVEPEFRCSAARIRIPMKRLSRSHPLTERRPAFFRIGYFPALFPYKGGLLLSGKGRIQFDEEALQGICQL